MQIYNAENGYSGTDAVTMAEQQWPLHPWQNEWERWHRIFDNQDPQANILPILAANKIVVVKSCFPSSEMIGIGQPADTILFTAKTLYNYKWHWRNIINVMRQHPENFFVIWTNAPHIAANTNPQAAILSKQFATWAKDTLAQGFDPEMGDFPSNVYVFNYFAKLTDANGYQLPEYAVSSSDSHPNGVATALIAPQFVNEIFDAAIAYEQGGPILSVAPLSRNVTSAAGVTTFSVSCNTDWTASSNASWCTITSSGTGNGTITANYSANNATTPRTATITVSADGASNQTVTVTQAGFAPAITVTPSNQNVTALAGSTSFTVTSNTNWTVQDNASWLTATSSGGGNGTIAANYTANTGTTARTATITISAAGAPNQIVTVIQAGLTPAFTVTPSNQNVMALPGSTSFSVTSNTNWTVLDNASWLTATSSGSGNGTITANYTANTGSSVRMATLTVTATGIGSVTITVTQAAANASLILTVSPSNQNVISNAGETSFTVTSNTNWSATSNAGWCVVTSAGSGNGTIEATYSANTGSSSRIATITVTASGLNSVLVTVTQSGSSTPELTITPLSQSVTGDAGTAEFAVTSNTTWTALSYSSWWCSVTPSGSGNGTIIATYSMNPGTSPRTATIKVSGAGVSNRIITVTQAGSLPFLTVTPSNQYVTANSGSRVYSVKSNTSWTAQSNSNWCTVTPGGNRNGVISANYTANSGATRIATITVSATGVNNRIVTLTQLGAAGKQTDVFENLYFSNLAGNYIFPQGLIKDYTIKSSAGWCKIVTSDAEDVIISFEENMLNVDRTALITLFNGNAEPVTFSIIQSGRLTNPVFDNKMNVQIFPNPSEGIFKLLIVNADKKDIQVTISDMLGRSVYSRNFSGDVSEDIDLKKEGSGIFVVMVSANNSFQRKSIIIR